LPDPTPRDVILAALLHPSPPQDVDPRPDVEWRADLIEQCLREARLLPPLEPPPVTGEDLDDLARWLAGESRHPRYTVEETLSLPAGWERLRVSETDVMVAYTAAIRWGSEAERVQRLQRARDLLTRNLR
jgi:hypothetical protein